MNCHDQIRILVICELMSLYSMDRWMVEDSVCLLDVSTLVVRDEGDILGSRRHTQYLVAIDLPLHLRQIAKGAGNSCGKVWNIADLHQKLHMGWST